ncbi:MAG: MBL fold metallo-hydrolase [Spirochaetia bacterium]|nr:MBL fold metallo-hydrolase [Spirochaetia bacterium]
MDIKLFYSGPMQVNSYICTDEETKKGFIIDPGGPNRTADKYIAEHGYEIEYIILTHGHGDHICGVPYYRDKLKAELIGHRGDDFLFLDEKENLSQEFTGSAITFTPDRYVTDGEIIKVGNMDVKVIHTPGHTPGGISLLVEKALFSGDTLFAQSIGRTDFKNGSFPELEKSIRKKLYILPDDTQVFPGHMGPTTIGDEKKYNMFVKDE